MDYFKRIDEYLDGELTGSELSSFLEELKYNPDLAKEVDLYKSVNSLLHEKADDDSKRKYLEKLHEEYINSRNTNTKANSSSQSSKYNCRTIFRYSIAAGLAILIIAAGIYFFIKGSPVSNQKLFATYYKPYEYSSVTRGSDGINSKQEDSYVLGLNQYEAAKYSFAIPYFQKTLKDDSTAYSADFFIGICYMEINEYDKAINSFIKISSDTLSDFSESARWYLGLCYIMTDGNPKAIEQFKFLKQNSSFYKNNSEEILSKIDK